MTSTRISNRYDPPATSTPARLQGTARTRPVVPSRPWLALGAVLIAGGAILGVTITLANQPAATPPRTGADVPDLSAYAPGGSVYNQQVPVPVLVDWELTAYAPGGSIYNSQVPAAARAAAASLYAAGSAYAPGGSIYNSQVPAAARAAAASLYAAGSAYAPGGSVYNSQVPAAARSGRP